MLKNKANGLSDDWTKLVPLNGDPLNAMYYIQSSTGVLECNTNNKQVASVVNTGKAEQLWVKGSPNKEGYFTLESSKQCSKVPKFMTAISASTLEIKGNHLLLA